MSDKIAAALSLLWPHIERSGKRGVVFAYDEAQVVSDNKDKGQYPLALLLGLFQSLQKKGMRYFLVLAGLPTLFARLVESRTYSERMFTIQKLGKLNRDDSRHAIKLPLRSTLLTFTPDSIEEIITLSGGYPYFIQFLCRECFEHFRLMMDVNPTASPSVPVDTIISKLDSDFFAGRWNLTTDRQRELLLAIALTDSIGSEFSPTDIEAQMGSLKGRQIASFKKADIAQHLPKIINLGLVYKNRHGKYSFAVPMFSAYIKRQFSDKHCIE